MLRPGCSCAWGSQRAACLPAGLGGGAQIRRGRTLRGRGREAWLSLRTREGKAGVSGTEAAWRRPWALGSGIPRACLSRQPEGGEWALGSGSPGCHVTSGPAFGPAAPHGGPRRGRGATVQSVWSRTPRALLGLLSRAPRWCHLGMVQPGACSGNGGHVHRKLGAGQGHCGCRGKSWCGHWRLGSRVENGPGGLHRNVGNRGSLRVPGGVWAFRQGSWGF